MFLIIYHIFGQQNYKMKAKRLILYIFNREIKTNFFHIASEKIWLILVNKLRFVLKYKLRLKLPNILIKYDEYNKCIISKIDFLIIFGFYYFSKKPKINPIIYEILIKILINLYFIYEIFLHYKI